MTLYSCSTLVDVYRLNMSVMEAGGLEQLLSNMGIDLDYLTQPIMQKVGNWVRSLNNGSGAYWKGVAFRGTLPPTQGFMPG